MTFWTFAVFDLGVLELVAVEALMRPHLSRPPAPSVRAVPAIATIVVSFALQLALLTYAVLQNAPGPLRGIRAPVPLDGFITWHPDAFAVAMLALTALQSYALLLLYRSAPSTRAVAVGTALVMLLALCSPVLISPDAYAYIGDALLGRAAYAPPALPFAGDLAAINGWWGVPMRPSPYGPVWIGAAWLVTAPFSSLLLKVVALRALGAAAIGALVLILRALGMPRRVLVVAALNPGLAFQYVASAHNDLFGIALVLAAALVTSRPWIAYIFLTAGALVKLPFALLGLPILAAMRTARARIVLAAAVAVTAVLISWVFGGAGLARALAPHVQSAGAQSVLWCAAAAAAAAALVLTIVTPRRLLAAVWLMPLTAAYSLASYLSWGLPYALARRNLLGYLLVCFPFAATLFEVKFMRQWTLFAVVPAVLALQAIAFIRGSSSKPA